MADDPMPRSLRDQPPEVQRAGLLVGFSILEEWGVKLGIELATKSWRA
jgi:hypothetical protein